MADAIKGKSPYQKYNKRPHKYSSLYNEWRSARLSNNTGQANILGNRHTKEHLGSSMVDIKEAAE